MNIYDAMALLLALQIKHLIADYYIQPYRWFADKHRYFSPGGACHALVHGFLSFLVLCALTGDLKFSLILSIVETVVHFHIDWIKASISKAKAWETDQLVYWAAFGSDQALHHLTYIIMVIAVERYV